MRDLLGIHGISAAIVDAHLANARQTSSSTASLSTWTRRRYNNSCQRDIRPNGHHVRASAGPSRQPAWPSIRNRTLADTNQHLACASHVEIGNTPADLDPSLAQQARLGSSQSCASPPTEHCMAQLVRPEPYSKTRDVPQQKLIYQRFPKSHSHSADAENQIISDDGSYTTQEILATRELPTSQSLPNTSTACCSTMGAIGRGSVDETDCEHAAHIIASMRGHTDHESIWPELGCSVARKCTIKTLTIFQMV